MKRAALRLTLDFDGTLTTSDTTSLLGALGLHHLQKHHPHLQPPEWSTFLDAYTKDLNAHNAILTVPSPYDDQGLRMRLAALHADPRIPEWKIHDLAHAIAYQNSLRSVESASYRRVLDSWIFSSLPRLTREEVEEAGRAAVERGDVRMRKGWIGFLSAVKGPDVVVDVLSVNWSRSWIRGCLRGAVALALPTVPDGSDDSNALNYASTSELQDTQEMVESWPITANELPGIDPDGYEYPPDPVRTSADKFLHYRRIQTQSHTLHACSSDANPIPFKSGQTRPKTGPNTTSNTCPDGDTQNNPKKTPTTRPEAQAKINARTDSATDLRSKVKEKPTLRIYIGDSPGDLECLLDADVGICIRGKAAECDHPRMVERLRNAEADAEADADADNCIPHRSTATEPSAGQDMSSGQRELKRILEEEGGLEVVSLRALRGGACMDLGSESDGGSDSDGTRERFTRSRTKDKKVLAWARDLHEVEAWIGPSR